MPRWSVRICASVQDTDPGTCELSNHFLACRGAGRRVVSKRGQEPGMEIPFELIKGVCCAVRLERSSCMLRWTQLGDNNNVATR